MNSNNQNSNKRNSNNFLLGVSSSKNNSLEKVNNESYNEFKNTREEINNNKRNKYSNTIINNISNSSSPLETKKLVFGIIDKLEKDIVNLNNKINSLNKEKIELKNLSDKEIKTLKEVIKKLYMILSSYYKSNSLNLSKNDRIALLNKIKNTFEQNDSFMKITNKIIRNDKSFNNELNRTFNKNTSLINESLNNNVSLSNIIANKNSQAKELPEINSRMTDNSFLKREEAINNSVQIPENIYSNNSVQVMNNSSMTQNIHSNNGVQVMNNSSMTQNIHSNNGSKVMNNYNMTEKVSNNGSKVKELNNNKNIYKSENKELTQFKKVPLITKINEHKINQEKANQNFNEYKKLIL
jgi:hypothetical protein